MRLGGELRFNVEDLQPWLAERTVTPSRDPALIPDIERSLAEPAAPTPPRKPPALPTSEPFTILNEDNLLTLTVFPGREEAVDPDRILSILDSLDDIRSDVQAAVQAAMDKPGSSVDLGPLPPALREDFNIFISRDKLNACLFISRKAHPTLAADDVLRELSLLDIQHGLNTRLIQMISHPEVPDRLLVIARGNKPRGDGHADLIIHFKTPRDFKPRKLESPSFQCLDFKQISRVIQDQLLAEIVLPKNMKNGVDVFGNQSTPDLGENLRLKAGPNTYFSHDRLRLHAACDGLAYWKKDAICVDRTCCPTEVGFETGNITFDGRVIINNNVLSGFSVEGKRKITVKGQVEGARVVSTNGSIIVHGGVRGNGKAELEAATNIEAPFAEGCRLIAGMNVTVKSSILRSTIYAGKSISMTEQNGRVAASSLTCCQSMSLVNVGSTGQERTTLSIHQPSDDGEGTELEHLTEQIKQSRRDIRACKVRIQRLVAQKSTAVPKEKEHLAQLEELLNKHEKAYQLFRKFCTDSETIFIDIAGTAFPGVEIVIEDRRLEIRAPIKAQRFYYSHGGILKKSL